VAKTRGSYLRKKEVLLWRGSEGMSGWKKVKEYCNRWIVEILIPILKRVLGDSVSSKKFLGQKIEASLKVMLYSKFKSF